MPLLPTNAPSRLLCAATLTFLTLALFTTPATAEPHVFVPIYDARAIPTPEASCDEFEAHETNHDFEPDGCRCRKADDQDLRVCHPYAKDAQNDYVPVALTIRHEDDEWWMIPLVRAAYHSHENKDHDINTWIGRKLRVISARAGTWRIQLRYERIFESKVHFLFEAGANVRPIQHIETYRCTGALAVTVDVSGPRPTLKTVADESFGCHLSDNDFAPDDPNPHPWFHLPTISRHLQLGPHGYLTGPGLPPACFDRPRLFPLRSNPKYEHFSRR